MTTVKFIPLKKGESLHNYLDDVLICIPLSQAKVDTQKLYTDLVEVKKYLSGGSWLLAENSPNLHAFMCVLEAFVNDENKGIKCS